ncbi:MAG TPA: hypothetical protein VH877_17410 [Polyangia bacterium]|jgi:hypothetical protein|nr:hypothetical protein [Polyangia bacterium]
MKSHDDADFNELVIGDLCDDLTYVSKHMRKWTYERLLASLDEVYEKYRPEVEGSPARERELRRCVAFWRYHFAHEKGQVDDAERTLRELLEFEVEVDSNIDFLGSFGRLCLDQGDPARGLPYVEQGLSLARTTTKDYVDRPVQITSLQEIIDLCHAALSRPKT